MPAKNLVIVESPAKAATIQRYLGGDFKVVSSFGHIRDLPKKGLGVDIDDEFRPTYEIPADKKKVAGELRRQAKAATVWLASDEDREGEAIAWHLCSVLNLDPEHAKRIVFHEITEPAIQTAVKKPRAVDQRLVDAQQARRVLDRLVGYKLSPVLWKKVQSGLSAGRVQSVAVRLIVEREREIAAFKPRTGFRVTADFKADGGTVGAELDSRLEDQTAATELLKHCRRASFTVESVEQKPGIRNPSPPFTTSTMQQEAARRLGFSVKQTMTLAQRLYENGYITYMRTDSTALARAAQAAAAAYLRGRFGEPYVMTRQYRTKNRSAQEAHEAIRPTDFKQPEAGADANQKKLYKLIWKRALASQMAPAAIEKTEVRIAISKLPKHYFRAQGEVLRFDGFIRVYGAGKEDVVLPPLSGGQTLAAAHIKAVQVAERPPARYGEASLVKKLEELGIGRPSTYAPTISTIQDRGYVEKKDLEGKSQNFAYVLLKGGRLSSGSEQAVVGADRAKLLPTQLAEVITDFLVKNFSDIVDYDFTARTETELDAVAAGKQSWQAMIKDFFGPFQTLLERSESISRSEATQARVLGKDPKSGLPVLVRFGRYGPVLQLGQNQKNDPKPAFAPLPEGATMQSVTLEQALAMFALPRTVGQTAAGQVITANIGRFGPYLKAGGRFVSIKGHDPLTITEQEARQLIAAKQDTAGRRLIQDFGDLKVVRGPYGPYITDGRRNARIPKEQDPAGLDKAAAADLLQRAGKAAGGRRRSWRSKKG